MPPSVTTGEPAQRLVAFSSFAGSDVRVFAISPRSKAVTDIEGNPSRTPPMFDLANLQTISISSFRETTAVRALGYVGEKGRARGARTVAGSLVFVVGDRHPLLDIMTMLSGDEAKDVVSPTDLGALEFSQIDQMPPLDLLLEYNNEFGAAAEMAIFGVEFASEGQVVSINDLYTEMTVQFTARHKTVMRPGGYSERIRRKATQEQTFGSILHGNYSDNVKELLRRSRYRMR